MQRKKLMMRVIIVCVGLSFTVMSIFYFNEPIGYTHCDEVRVWQCHPLSFSCQWETQTRCSQIISSFKTEYNNEPITVFSFKIFAFFGGLIIISYGVLSKEMSWFK